MIKHLRHMLTFSTIVDEGSISAAANHLNVSKSVISQQLQSLEQALNVQLLNRTTRRQVLTPAGRQFYLQCQKIAQIGDQAWSDARESQHMALGNICISAPHALIDSILAPAMGQLLQEFPKIEPHLLAQDQRIHLLDEGIDLAIRVGELTNSEFKQRKLGQFRDHLCVSRHYAETVNLTDLSQFTAQTTTLDYIANSWQGQQISHDLIDVSRQQPLTFSFTANRSANSIHGVLAMVKAGLGIGLIPEFLLDKHISADLLILTERYQILPAPVVALHAFDKRPPYIVRLAIQAITQQMKTLAP